MKTYLKKIKIFTSKFLAGICMLICILALIFFTDMGHNLILNCIEKYLRFQNIELQIKGMNRNITNIDEIYIKIPMDMEIFLSDISLKRKNIFSIPTIHIEKLKLNGTNQENDLRKSLKQIIPSMKTIRKFLSKLTLKQGCLVFEGNGTYNIEDLLYQSAGTTDKLFAKINDTHKLSICASWNIFECESVIINFDNIFGFTGSFYIQAPEKELTKYKISAKNTKLQIEGIGSYTDFVSSILIESLSVLHEQKVYKASGIIFPEKEEMRINAKISADEYIKNLPIKVSKNFVDTICCVNFNYNFGGNKESLADIDILKSEKNLGKIQCILHKDNLDIDGNIDWINIHGFQLKKLKCRINEFKNADIFLAGDGFNITSQCNIKDESIIVDDLIFEIPQNGYIKSTSKFILKKDKDIECPFEFDIKDLEFFSNIAPISGDAVGHGKYQNGNITFKNQSNQIKYKKYQINDLDVMFDGKDISFIAKNAILLGSKFSNLEAYIKNKVLNAKCKTSNNFNISASGKVSKSYKKISLDKCNMNSTYSKIDIKTFDLDFINKCHKIYCEIIDGNNKGIVDISSQNDSCNITLNSINTKLLRKIIDPQIPQCTIDGKMNFDFRNDFVNGNGALKIFGLISPKNIMDISMLLSNSGLKLNANLLNSNEFFKIDAHIPFTLRSDGNVIKNNNVLLNCSIKGNTKIENFLELSDGMDARGTLNCNVKLSGDLSNPILNGDISMQNAYFIINDVTLKNGSISLKCTGNSINVMSANFTDYRGKKLDITGNGKFFFDNLVPNINTNLKLNSDNFMLFDSDNMRIAANGIGAITGKINDLTISGNVELPECKILKFNTDDSNSNNEIVIENERNIQKKSEKEEEHDFCKYDIKMSCPKIEIIGKAFEVDLLGNLKLATYQNKSTMTGHLKLSHGRVSVFGKRMKMSSGSVKFLEEYPFDPSAHFLCENNFGDLIAYLEIVNKPQKGVSLNLYSRPNYSQDIILSNIIFGKWTRYLNVTEAAQLAHAVASLKSSGGYIFSILNAFQKIGIIDNISVTTNSQQTEDSLLVNEQNANGKQGVNVSAGKYIHDNIYVSVNKNSEEEMASFDVDLAITDTLSVKANTNGEAGISWKYRY